jgi:hypothetical protein
MARLVVTDELETGETGIARLPAPARLASVRIETAGKLSSTARAIRRAVRWSASDAWANAASETSLVTGGRHVDGEHQVSGLGRGTCGSSFISATSDGYRAFCNLPLTMIAHKLSSGRV